MDVTKNSESCLSICFVFSIYFKSKKERKKAKKKNRLIQISIFHADENADDAVVMKIFCNSRIT